MKEGISLKILVVFSLLAFMVACAPPQPATAIKKKVIAVETFLADIAKNIAGERIAVDALLPPGADPHTYEPTPQDGARLADSDLIIINGAEFESWINPLLKNIAAEAKIVVASENLTPREHEEDGGGENGHHEVDPHFWLDPERTLVYLENIRKAFEKMDKDGAAYYKIQCDAYSHNIKQLDQWIIGKIGELPAERRLLVTNHESLGYFAERYGFRIVGTIIPSVSTGTSPSTQQMAKLIEDIKTSKVPAIFLETGANPQLARQIERETGAKVILDLNTHSVDPGKPGQSTYLEMMQTMVETIVSSLMQ